MSEEQERPKTGKSTSEFWVTTIFALLLLIGAGVGYAFGKLDYVKALEIVGIAMAILGFGYSAARGLSKYGSTKSVSLLIGAGLLFSGCGQSTLKTALDGLCSGAKAVSAAYEPALQADCMAAARECVGRVKTIEECAKYIKCRDIQRDLALSMRAIHYGIIKAEGARKRAMDAGFLGR